MVGAHVAVLPAASLGAARAVDWVGVGEFDHACAEVSEGRRLADVKGIAYRDGDRVRFTPPRPPIEDMDALPFVVDVYRRDLTIENYFIGYLLHPYVSLYTRAGLPIQVHLLPVAADGRRPSLPGAKPGERRGRDGPGQGPLPPGARVLLRR